MRTQPTLSIIVTTHCRPDLLGRALSSLIQQTRQDFEILLCADECSEDTLFTANEYLRPQDSLIALPALRGPASTRNFGVIAAQGRWICFLDDDDSFEKDYVERALPELESRPDALHYFNFTRIIEDRSNGLNFPISREEVFTNAWAIGALEIRNFIPVNAFFVPAIVAKASSFDVSLGSLEDWDYLLGLSKKCVFLHHDQTGPVVHVSTGHSRNNDSVTDHSFMLDYLSIYRQWPGSSDLIKQERQKVLEGYSISIPAAFL